MNNKVNKPYAPATQVLLLVTRIPAKIETFESNPCCIDKASLNGLQTVAQIVAVSSSHLKLFLPR